MTILSKHIITPEQRGHRAPLSKNESTEQHITKGQAMSISATKPKPKQARPKTIKIVELKMVRERSVKYDDAIITSENVVNMVKDIFANTYREIVVVMGVDNQIRPTIIHIVGVGTTNCSPVFVPSVIKPLLLSNSQGCIMIHNHPTNTMHPSNDDIKVTKRIIEACTIFDITLFDHIILNGDATEHFSMRKSRHWPV